VPYSFAASEALRLHAFKLDRAQVRRWAIENHLVHAVPAKRVLAPVRRWQRARIGKLWQLDASPHRWFPSVNRAFPMLNMLDDCSRLYTGSKLYERELLLAYFDFLPAAFLAHGRPLELYVDYHSLFFTQDPDALTQLGWALKFYDISLRYAPTPQAKGKIEREHQFWQGRLPAYFASEKIAQIHVANPHIDTLRAHRNAHEVHRELRQTPQRAWNQAKKENRSVVRPVPRCPWWHYVWSVRTPIKIGTDGVACPSARSGCASKNRPGAKSCSACIPRAITPCWPLHPRPEKNPCSFSPIAPNEGVLFLLTTKYSCFENYATFAIHALDGRQIRLMFPVADVDVNVG
jgi:hypothetical protein